MRVDLIQLARERALKEGWQLAVCLTDLPLLLGRRPVTAHLSVTFGAGVVSVPALGAVELQDRVMQAVLGIVDRLLTGKAAEEERKRHVPPRMRARLRARVREYQQLTSPVGRPYPLDQRTVRFVTAAGQGNLRLLIGMLRANRPWRLIIGLSRALVGALGLGAFGLTSPAVWMIADGLDAPRSLLLALGSIVAICCTIIVAHGLLERSPSPEVRERVALINLATVLTVTLEC